MLNLSRRSDRPEAMDAPDLSADEYRRCLADLERVNRLTLTHRPTLAWLERATRDMPKGAGFSVLDVGSGGGDLLRAMARFARRRGLSARLAGLDLNPRSAAIARVKGGAIAYHTGSVFEHVPRQPPDFIVSSQFAHHLGDADIVRFLQWMERHAARGWFVADLRRTRFAYLGFRLLCRAAGWHPIVRADGTISIARSFRADDWRALLDRAGLQAEISPHFPSRLCVGRLK